MASTSRQVAIVTDDPGWHGRQLRESLARHGLESCYVLLTEAWSATDEDLAYPRLPGFEQTPPLGVFIRGIPGGTLEQVIFRLDVLHMYVEQGITVYNNPRAIERTVDKAMTSFLLKQAGIPTPATWVCESVETACGIYRRETAAGHQLVLKPVFGSQGIGVQRLNQAPDRISQEQTGGVFYLQRFIKPGADVYQDIRVFVIDGVAVAGMIRSHHDWITNRAQGGTCKRLVLNDRIRDLAEAAVRACAIDYAGVDLITDEHGELQVLEVNSVPAWWGLQKVVDINIASALVDSFVARINAAAEVPAVCR
ncbi:MAG: RimK family alpha-L-glutamate ligase [Gammaproteobacteria bacterium]|nr:RimK family alpha-L-glutamate ligase [Gammaproteobacteria bacterium]